MNESIAHTQSTHSTVEEEGQVKMPPWGALCQHKIKRLISTKIIPENPPRVKKKEKKKSKNRKKSALLSPFTFLLFSPSSIGFESPSLPQCDATRPHHHVERRSRSPPSWRTVFWLRVEESHPYDERKGRDTHVSTQSSVEVLSFFLFLWHVPCWSLNQESSQKDGTPRG